MQRTRALAIVLLAVLLGSPRTRAAAQSPATPAAFAPLLSQTAAYTTHYEGQRFVLLGVQDGEPVFEGTDGSPFSVDKSTHEPRSVTIRRARVGRVPAGRWRRDRIVVAIADRDLDGRLVMRNRRNVYFVLNATTAKFIFIKWPK